MGKPNLLTFVRRGANQVRTLGPSLLVDRYWHRRGILATPPIPCPPDASLEVHVQVCRRDCLNALWTLKTFAHFSAEPFRLVLLEDGSLRDVDRARLQSHFPGVHFCAE